MTKSVGVHEAKTQLSRLLQDVAAGEDVIISNRGVAVARLVPVAGGSKRELGTDRGQMSVPENFDDPLVEEYLAGFEA